MRRTDFVAIAAILSASGLPAPVPDRATLRRFRRMVADLGAELYLAFSGTEPVGFVHLSYCRDIALGNRARIEVLVVAPGSRRSGVGRALLQFARERAARRACHDVRCSPGGESEPARSFLARAGWRPAGDDYRVELPPVAGQIEELG